MSEELEQLEAFRRQTRPVFTCQTCGKTPLAGEVDRCPNCGATGSALRGAEAWQSDLAASQQIVSASNKGGCIGLVIGLLIVAAVIGGLFYAAKLAGH
jgi:ribosomal protein L37E